jgi:NAD(P)-dependent dehydrogenase (short-subunit alcohol dehydrogenase family)
MASRVRSESGHINLLICNAGMSGPTLEALKPRYTLADFVNYAWGSSMEDFNATYNLNCTAVFYTVLAFLELLDEGNKKKNYLKSQVIATASTASFLRVPRAGYAYTSSKTAVISLIKSLSTFCVPWGIRFNAIAAGRMMLLPRPPFPSGVFLFVLTQAGILVFPSEMSEIMFKPYIINKEKKITEEGVFSRSYQPAERAGSIEDMAGTTLYMASRAGVFLNGSVMLVDGGKLATMPATY